MTKKRTEPFARLETLIRENAQLKRENKELKGQCKDWQQMYSDIEAIAEGCQLRERKWPTLLTPTQRLYQLGILLSFVLYDDAVAPAVKEAFGAAIEQLAERCQAHFPRLVQSLEARHVFPEMALMLADVEDNTAPDATNH